MSLEQIMVEVRDELRQVNQKLDRLSLDSSGPALNSMRDAADALGVSVRWIQRRIADGTITPYKTGKIVRVDLAEIRRAMRQKVGNVQVY